MGAYTCGFWGGGVYAFWDGMAFGWAHRYGPHYLRGWSQARWSLIESIDGLEFV